jgi:hypothetical protein
MLRCGVTAGGGSGEVANSVVFQSKGLLLVGHVCEMPKPLRSKLLAFGGARKAGAEIVFVNGAEVT